MSDLPERLRISAAKVMPGIPRDQLLEAAAEIETLQNRIDRAYMRANCADALSPAPWQVEVSHILNGSDGPKI